MSDITVNINRVNAKLQKLLKNHALLQRDNNQQKQLVIRLQQSEKDLTEKMESLYRQQLILKASLDKLDEKEKKELEQKINGYVQNIDKCISLLSHKPNP